MSPKLILDQRGAHMAEVPGGRQRITVPGLQGQESRSAGIDSGVVSLVAELRARERQAAEDWPVEDPRGGAQAVDASLAAFLCWWNQRFGG